MQGRQVQIAAQGVQKLGYDLVPQGMGSNLTLGGGHFHGDGHDHIRGDGFGGSHPLDETGHGDHGPRGTGPGIASMMMGGIAPRVSRHDGERFAEGGVLAFQGGGTLRTGGGWEPRVAAVVDEMDQRFPAIQEFHTYPGHPTHGEHYSVDIRMTGWQQYASGPEVSAGNEVVDFLIRDAVRIATEYIIWQNQINEGGGWAPFGGAGPTDGHYDHIHWTAFPNGQGRPIGGGGFAGGPDYSAMIDEHVPRVPDFPTHVVGDAAKAMVGDLREKLVERLMEEVGGGTWNGGGDLDEWITKGILFGGVFQDDAATHSAIRARAMQESGGDPNAVNNWDSNAAAGIPSKGVMQIIGPTWEQWRNQPGPDAGPFEPNWSNPIRSVGVATRYMQGVYGGPVGATGVGYTDGGIALQPQVATVAEHGPEFFMPLHDPQSARRFWDFVRDVAPMAGGVDEAERERMAVLKDTLHHTRRNADNNTRLLSATAGAAGANNATTVSGERGVNIVQRQEGGGRQESSQLQGGSETAQNPSTTVAPPAREEEARERREQTRLLRRLVRDQRESAADIIAALLEDTRLDRETIERLKGVVDARSQRVVEEEGTEVVDRGMERRGKRSRLTGGSPIGGV